VFESQQIQVNSQYNQLEVDEIIWEKKNMVKLKKFISIATEVEAIDQGVDCEK
jgi:hypothetical protein